jgi:hypothetical protein
VVRHQDEKQNGGIGQILAHQIDVILEKKTYRRNM